MASFAAGIGSPHAPRFRSGAPEGDEDLGGVGIFCQECKGELQDMTGQGEQPGGRSAGARASTGSGSWTARTGASKVSSRVERPASPGTAPLERRLRDCEARVRQRDRDRAARRRDGRGPAAASDTAGVPSRARFRASESTTSAYRRAGGLGGGAISESPRLPAPTSNRPLADRHAPRGSVGHRTCSRKAEPGTELVLARR